MHDDQLREQFTTWAQPLQAVRPPALPVLRQRSRRRAVGRTAVSGLAAVGVAASVVLSGFPWAGRGLAVSAPASGPPRYAVALEYRTSGLPASVLDMATGKVAGQVATPRAGSDFTWVAAASDDRTFVLADQSPALGYRFYRLHLAANGKPGGLTQLAVSLPHGSQIYGMALTADAGKLAVAWQNNPPGPGRGHISVTAMATGVTRTWTSAHGGALNVSWAGDRTLAFDWQDTGPAHSGLRLLDTAAAGTTLLASRLLVPASFQTAALSSPGDPLITQDGATLFAGMAAGRNGTESAIVSFSVRTGKLEAVLGAPSAPSLQYCGVLWTDARGRHLITQCGTTQVSINGNRHIRIHLHEFIPASPDGTANTFAW